MNEIDTTKLIPIKEKVVDLDKCNTDEIITHKLPEALEKIPRNLETLKEDTTIAPFAHYANPVLIEQDPIIALGDKSADELIKEQDKIQTKRSILSYAMAAILTISIGQFAYMHKDKLFHTLVIEEQAEAEPEVKFIDSAKVSKITEQEAFIDSQGRHAVKITVKSVAKRNRSYNTTLTANFDLKGKDADGRDWEGTIKSINMTSSTADVVPIDKALVITDLAQNEIRHIIAYPDFSDNNLKDITIEEVKHVEVSLTEAVRTDWDKRVIPTTEISYTEDRAKNKKMKLSGTIRMPASVDTATVYFALIDGEGNLIGTNEEKNVTFPFGFELVHVLVHKNDNVQYGNFDVICNGKATRVVCLGAITKDNSKK